MKDVEVFIDGFEAPQRLKALGAGEPTEREEKLPVSGDTATFDHLLVGDYIKHDEKSGLFYERLIVYKGLDASRYGKRRGEMRPWYEIRVSEIGGVEVRAYDYEHAEVGFRDLEPDDKKLLYKILKTLDPEQENK